MLLSVPGEYQAYGNPPVVVYGDCSRHVPNEYGRTVFGSELLLNFNAALNRSIRGISLRQFWSLTQDIRGPNNQGRSLKENAIAA